MKPWLVVLASTFFARSCASVTDFAINEAAPQPSQEPLVGAAPSPDRRFFVRQANEEGGLSAEGSKQLRASLELRRLSAQQRPAAIPRPKGYPALLSGAAALGHALYQAVKTYNTHPYPPAAISLGIGRARFDSVNMGFFTLALGLGLLFYGIRRRWTNHKVRNRWRVDELLRQDRLRVEHLRSAAKGGH